MEVYILQLKKRKKIYTSLVIAFWLLLPIIFYTVTVHETMSFGKDVLGQERYEERMHDSITYAAALFALLMPIMIPAIYLLQKTINMYLNVIPTLSATDIEKLKNSNEHAVFWEKYMPSYIIRDGAVIIFRLARQQTIYFKDIKSIHIKQGHYKGYSAIVRITTEQKTQQFIFYGNPFKVSNLVQEALIVNPVIEVNKDWNR